MKRIISLLLVTQLSTCFLLALQKAGKDSETPKKDATKESDATGKTNAEKDNGSKNDDGEKEEKTDTDEKKGEDEEKPKTHKVEKETFRIELKLDSAFEGASTSEVSISTKSWALLTVLEALPQGAKVKKGQSLV
ncbi:MAG: hypothetical protein VB997_10360, partial [Opitutales bacterium]